MRTRTRGTSTRPRSSPWWRTTTSRIGCCTSSWYPIGLGERPGERQAHVPGADDTDGLIGNPFAVHARKYLLRAVRGERFRAGVADGPEGASCSIPCNDQLDILAEQRKVTNPVLEEGIRGYDHRSCRTGAQRCFGMPSFPGFSGPYPG